MLFIYVVSRCRPKVHQVVWFYDAEVFSRIYVQINHERETSRETYSSGKKYWYTSWNKTTRKTI